MTVDFQLSNISTNPVANNVVKRALDRKADSVALNNKADSNTLAAHINDNDVHVTLEEKERWNSCNKVDVEDHLAENNNPVSSIVLKRALEEKAEKKETQNHIDNSEIHIKKEERKAWNQMIIKDDLLSSSFQKDFQELTKEINNYDILIIDFLSSDESMKVSSLVHNTDTYDKMIPLSIGNEIAKVAFHKNEKKDILTIHENESDFIITSVTGYQFNQVSINDVEE